MIKQFVPLFKGLSCDGMFHVRKVRHYLEYIVKLCGSSGF